MSEKKYSLEEDNKVVSQERRDLLKKAAYTAPTLVVLGVITPIDKGYAMSNPPPDPSSPLEGPDPTGR